MHIVEVHVTKADSPKEANRVLQKVRRIETHQLQSSPQRILEC